MRLGSRRRTPDVNLDPLLVALASGEGALRVHLEALAAATDERASFAARALLGLSQRDVELANARAGVAHDRALPAGMELARRVSSARTIRDAVSVLEGGVATVSEFARGHVWLAADGRACLNVGGSVSRLDRAMVSVPDAVLAGRVARTRKPMALGEDGEEVVPLEEVHATAALGIPLLAFRSLVGILQLSADRPVPTAPGAVDAVLVASELAAPALGALVCKFVSEQQSRDPLTRLYTRARFLPDLRDACQDSIGTGEPLSLLFVDLDHFKRVNDTYGHQVGDEVLRGVGGIIASTIRESDSGYRYGGEELCVIARQADERGGAQLAERLRRAVEAAYAADPRGLRVTASIGVAEFDKTKMRESNDLTESADRAVYAAKRAGRNQVCPASWIQG